MTCPVCGSPTIIRETITKVDCIYRRRICKECKHVFKTEEVETHEALPKKTRKAKEDA